MSKNNEQLKAKCNDKVSEINKKYKLNVIQKLDYWDRLDAVGHISIICPKLKNTNLRGQL